MSQNLGTRVEIRVYRDSQIIETQCAPLVRTMVSLSLGLTTASVVILLKSRGFCYHAFYTNF